MILETAARLFMKHGYDAVSFKMLIAEIGGSRRDIYALFNDKKTLFLESVAHLCEQLTEPLQQGNLPKSNDAPHLALRAFAGALQHTALKPETLALHRLMIGEGQRFPELAFLLWQKGVEQPPTILAAWIERQQEKGVLREGNARRMADLFVDMLVSRSQVAKLVGHPSLRQHQTDLDAIADDVVAIFLDGAAISIR